MKGQMKVMALSILSLPQKHHVLGLISTSTKCSSSPHNERLRLYLCAPQDYFSQRPTTCTSFQRMSMSSASSDTSNQSVELAISLLNSVYGPIDSPEFPLPMSDADAGPCYTFASYDNHQRQQHGNHPPHLPQRRYLWTDAFGVLAYQSLAEYYSNTGNNRKQTEMYNHAVEKLICVVHECLGKPRSDKEEDAMTECDISPTGYVGLRIGKVRFALV